jgi:hypothetical protein
VRRDFYIWLAFSGCGASETMSMMIANIDLKRGSSAIGVTAWRRSCAVKALFGIAEARLRKALMPLLVGGGTVGPAQSLFAQIFDQR